MTLPRDWWRTDPYRTDTHERHPLGSRYQDGTVVAHWLWNDGEPFAGVRKDDGEMFCVGTMGHATVWTPERMAGAEEVRWVEDEPVICKAPSYYLTADNLDEARARAAADQVFAENSEVLTKLADR